MPSSAEVVGEPGVLRMQPEPVRAACKRELDKFL